MPSVRQTRAAPDLRASWAAAVPIVPHRLALRAGARHCNASWAIPGRKVRGRDPAGPSWTREILAESFRDGVLESRAVFSLRENIYFPNEVVLLLERTG